MPVSPKVTAIYLAAILAAAVSRADATLQRFEYEHLQMGTWFRLVIYAPHPDVADAAATAAFSRVDALNGMLSDYIPESEVSRLTAPENLGVPVPISEDLCRILLIVGPVQSESDGALDLTAGPVTHLWREARRQGSPPDAASIKKAMGCIGFGQIRLDPTRRTATPLASGMRLDLGAVAKGYAADCALQECRARGLNRALVAAGGDVVVGDPPPDQEGWRVGLPALTGDRAPQECLVIARGAVSTSGDQNQFLIHAGTRHSHIIDPRTGTAITHGCTVTVTISGTPSDGLMADALATAVSVLGPEHGPDLLRRFGTAGGRIIQPGPSEPTAQTTPGFRKWRVEPLTSAGQPHTGSGMSHGAR